MDEDVSRWILEFLLRQPTPDHVICKALSALPLSNRNSRFKKTLLLRSIQSEIRANSSVSEAILKNLEIIEELDRIDGIAITDSMRVAYSAVAVDCTLKYVGEDEDKRGEYFAAVKRIWRGRVEKMEGKSDLFSDELRKWRDEIEAAVFDEDVCGNLLEKKKNSGENALKSLKCYLEEAWEIMGPTFLESAARTMMGLQGSGTGNGQADHIVGVRVASEFDSSRDLGGSDNDRVELAAQKARQGEAQELGDQQVSDKVGERAASLHGSGCTLGGNDRDGVEFAAQMANQEEVHGLGDQQVSDTVVQTAARLHNSGQDLGCSDGGKLELAAEAMDQEQKQRVGENVREKVVKSTRKKHAARRRRIGKGVKIVDSDDSGSDTTCTKYDRLPTPEVTKVLEALRSSNLELQAMVKDPLPDALRVSEIVRSEMAGKNDNPSVENHDRADVVEAPIPATERTIEPVQAHEANPRTQSDVTRPSLMERNSTARTYEWDDSIDDDLPEGMSNSMTRPHLPSPKRVDCSPLKKAQDITKFTSRRRKRMWSLLEEDTLRTGVQKYGKGKWKLILHTYRDIFEDRTEVDLKDKWRNMTR